MADIKIYKTGKPESFYLIAEKTLSRKLSKKEQALLIESRPELLTDDKLRMLVMEPHSLKQIGINI